MGSGLVSPWHIAILVLVVLLVFGPKKLPEIGRSLGRSIYEFKGGIAHRQEEGEAAESRPPALPAGTARDRDTI